MDNKRLKEVLAARRIKQTELASALNVTNATVSQWVSGKREPNDESKKQLAAYLGVSLDYLVGSATADLAKARAGDTGGHTGVGSDFIGINPDTTERAVWFSVFNYSELVEDFSMAEIEKIPLSAARFKNFNTSKLFLIRQDIPFRQAAEGNIPCNCLAIASKEFDFSNSKLYLVTFRGRCFIRRVTRCPDGCVDLASDEGTKTVTVEEQTTYGFRILARIIARVPDEISFFD